MGDQPALTLAARDMRQGVPYPVDAAALPSSLEGALYRGPEAAMGVGDHQLGAVQPTRLETAQEVHPEGLGFGRAKSQTDDFPAPVGVCRHGDYRRDADDPAALTPIENNTPRLATNNGNPTGNGTGGKGITLASIGSPWNPPTKKSSIMSGPSGSPWFDAP